MSRKSSNTGHNSLDPQLAQIVERIERLTLEKQAIADGIKDVYAEAKGKGYDTPTIRNVIRLRKMEAEKRRATLDLIDRYMHALGMLGDTPLGNAAAEAAAKMN
jgi:uncharacterized protein (UPF0335 family)